MRQFGLLPTVVLFAMLATATVTDLARHKIYNWTTYPGIVLAIVLSAGQYLVARACGTVEWQDRMQLWLGSTPLRDCLAGLFGCGLLMVVCFLLFAGQVGGGDVKLLAAMGALLGLEKGLESLLWTFVLAAAVAVICLIWKVGPLRIAGFMFRMVGGWLTRRRGTYLTEDERKLISPPLYLAPSALAAAVIVRFSLIQ